MNWIQRCQGTVVGCYEYDSVGFHNSCTTLSVRIRICLLGVVSWEGGGGRGECAIIWHD